MAYRFATFALIIICTVAVGNVQAQGRPPVVSALQPTAGQPGAWLTIIGQGFDPRCVVFLNGVGLPVARFSPTQLVVQIPNGVAGGYIVVQSPYGQAVSPQPLQIIAPAPPPPQPRRQARPVPRPAIGNVAPRAAKVGDVVKLTGMNFGTSAELVKVMLEGVPVRVLEVTPNYIAVQIPPQARSGLFSVEVLGRGRATAPGPFTLVLPVTITGFTPKVANPGGKVLIHGGGFDKDPRKNTVTMGRRVLPVLRVAANKLEVQLPDGATTDHITIKTAMGSTATSMQKLEVVPKLKVTGFTPTSGGPGTYVTVHGEGFQIEGLRAFLGGVPVGLGVRSPTQAYFKVPDNADTATISLVADKAGAAASRQVFTVNHPLALTDVTPRKARPGQQITLVGTGFPRSPRGTVLKLGKAKVPILEIKGREMVAVVPVNASAGNFALTVPGKGTAQLGVPFEVDFPLAISGIEPASGPPGTLVTVTGTGFAGRRLKGFLGPKPIEIDVLSPTEAAFPVPEQARSGAVTVIAQGVGQTSSKDIFQVTAPAVQPAVQPGPEPEPVPADDGIESILGIEETELAVVISGFDPMDAMGEDVVTVQGSGFGEDPGDVAVWVGETVVEVMGVVPDMVMFEVPGGCPSGKIRIRVGDNVPIESRQTLVVVY